MIERAVLLREDHDVFKISDLGATGGSKGNDFGEAASMQTKTCEFCYGCSASELEDLAASKFVHRSQTLRCHCGEKGRTARAYESDWDPGRTQRRSRLGEGGNAIHIGILIFSDAPRQGRSTAVADCSITVSSNAAQRLSRHGLCLRHLSPRSRHQTAPVGQLDGW